MHDARLAQDVASLRGVPLFAGLAPEELAACVRVARRRRAKPRERVVRQGDDDASLYVVLEGRLRVVAEGARGEPLGLTVLGAGDVFGELALFDGGRRSASVVALEACTLLVFSRDAFRDLLARLPALSLRALELLAGRVRSLAARAEDGSLDARARLAKALLLLSARFGAAVDARRRELDLRMSQRDLAALVGASREVVNRVFREWSERGILRRPGGGRLVLDEEALRRVAAS